MIVAELEHDSATTHERKPGPAPRTFTWNGRTLPLLLWAQQPEIVALGIGASALYERARRGWSVEEVSAACGVSVERVRQIEAAALAKLERAARHPGSRGDVVRALLEYSEGAAEPVVLRSVGGGSR